jgi:hypothetical protein
MNSIPPSAAGVPTGNNNKYIVIALLLLLGVGGLSAWKFSRPDPPATVTTVIAPIATTAAKPPHQDDDIPPPETVPTATATAAPKASGTAPAGGGGNGCPATCNGSVGDDLKAALALRGRQARKCYERELANDPKLSVHMVMSVRVSGNGSVCAASVASSDNPTVSTCVANQFRGSFPAVKGACADINVPLNFVPNR